MINFKQKSIVGFFISISTVLLIASCSSRRMVSFNVTRPAEITLPQDVNTILLVDRTKFSNETLNIIEGILTGEMPADDKNAAHESMMSLKNKLDYSPRYNVKILPDRLVGNSISRNFPPALKWDVVDNLCKSNNCELLVSLEVFDSNFIVTNGTRIKKKSEGEGKNKREVEYTEYYAQGVARVKIGIRTYYGHDKKIVDEQMISKDNTWEATGSNPVEAVGMLITKSNANKYLASAVGEDYAYKISPMNIQIARAFYGKSKHVPEVETGARFADVNKWEDAINIWKKALPKAKSKDAGRIAYNIAIGYEVLGAYGTALTWAQDSYTKYNNKDGRYYAQSLEYRIEEEKVLKEQMTR